MSDLETGVTRHAMANAALSARVGGRFYPLFIPADAALPAIAYQRISGNRVHDHDGIDTYERARIQVTCQAVTYDAAKETAHLVRQAFRGYRGQMGGSGGAEVLEVVIENELDGFNSDGDMFTVRIDLLILHADSD